MEPLKIFNPVLSFLLLTSSLVLMTTNVPQSWVTECTMWRDQIAYEVSSFVWSIPPASWLLNARDYLRALFIEWGNEICRLTPPRIWDRWPFHTLECERRLHPWWWAFKQLMGQIHLVSLIVVCICVVCSVFATVHFVKTLPNLLKYRRWRRSRWALAWWLGRRQEIRLFCPRSPAGRENGTRWTTTSNGDLATWRAGIGSEVSQPLPLLDRTVHVAGFLFGVYPARVTHTYSGNELHIIWEPEAVTVESVELTQPPATEYPIKRVFDGQDVLTWLTSAGSYRSVCLGEDQWTTITSMLDGAGKDTQVFSVETLLNTLGPGLDKKDLKMVSSYVALQWNKKKRQFPEVEESLPAQVLEGVGDVRDDPTAPFKTTGRTVLPVFVTKPDSMPCTGTQGDLAAIQYRLDFCRNGVPTFDTDVKKAFTQFVDRVVGTDKIAPWSLQALLDHQDGPLQRIRNARDKWDVSLFGQLGLKCKAMLKIEPVVNRNAVRNISTVPGGFNLPLGCYLMAAAEHLKKKFEWYAAGKTPDQIGRRIVEIANRSQELNLEVCAADVSKMDAGKHPQIMAWVTTRIYMRLFGLDEEHLVELRKAEHTIKSTTNTGMAYKNGCSQMSGSASTTIDNTLTSAFFSFLGYIYEGYHPDVAFEMLGAYCGDDSVSNNCSGSMEAVGEVLGYTIKSEMIAVGEPIPFLSRFFYRAWVGSPASLQDPVRLLRKMHISISPKTVPPRQAAVAKLKGYASLEPGNWLYQSLYQNAKRLAGCDGDNTSEMSYMQRQYIADGGWAMDDGWTELWVEKTQVSPHVFSDWADKCRSWQEFLAGPPILVCTDAPPKIAVTCNPMDPCETPILVSEEPVPPTATIAPPGVQLDTPALVVAERRERQATRELDNMVRAERRRERAPDRRTPPPVPLMDLQLDPPPFPVGNWALDGAAFPAAPPPGTF